MPYFIDGHNLIPHIEGLSLAMVDDEAALVDYLAPLLQRLHKKAVIFFDRAFPGSPQLIHNGSITIRFVRKPLSADEAILKDLKSLAGAAKNYTVVTSDRLLAQSAIQLSAQVMPCEKFLLYLHRKNPTHSKYDKDANDIDYWLTIFDKNS